MSRAKPALVVASAMVLALAIAAPGLAESGGGAGRLPPQALGVWSLAM